MKINRLDLSKFSIVLILSLASANVSADYFSGLSTRDQNPVLMSFWIPHTFAPLDDKQHLFSPVLSITNTIHDEDELNEKLFIDGEVYRLDLNFQYQTKRWLVFSQLPLISSRGGFVDKIIFDWHDFFGIPQGDRAIQPNDLIQYKYSRNGQTVFDERIPFKGVGDISIGGSYFLKPSSDGIWSIGLGLNIPTGNSNLVLNSETIESAIWASYTSKSSLKRPHFFSAGMINTSSNSLFQSYVANNVAFIQSGFELKMNEKYSYLFQLDYHSSFIQETRTVALGDSLQIQIGLKFKWLEENKDLSLFFSEDLLYQSAPDITFSTQFIWKY